MWLNFQQGASVFSALRAINFSVSNNETLGIVGESGSGKSITCLSILRLLNQQIAKYPSGEILFKGENILTMEEQKLQTLRGKQISMIFQEPMTSLNPLFTCGNQVVEALQTHTALSLKEAKERVFQLFEEVKLPDPLRIYKAYPHEISGGQKQRVMIAMALSCNPDLLIADEPTTALDVTVQKNILELLHTIQQNRRMSMLFISHDLGVVQQVADSVMVMYQGEIVEHAPKDQFFKSPQHPYSKGLLACKPSPKLTMHRLPEVKDFLQADESDIKHVISERLSSAEGQEKRKLQLIEAPTILHINNISVEYVLKKNFFGKVSNTLKAVNGVSLEMKQGETVGLVGESGCGKSTIGKALLGLVPLSAGSINYYGKNISKLTSNEWKKFRPLIQLIFQDPYSSQNPKINIGNALKEPLDVHFRHLTEKEKKIKVIQLLEKVGLKESDTKKYPSEFSGGQRQRIVIARALILEPKLVICDESVAALDVSVQAQVLNLLSDLRDEFGLSLLFISHDLSVVKHLSDRIAVMHAGSIVEIGNSNDVYFNPTHPYTQQLINSIPTPIAASFD